MHMGVNCNDSQAVAQEKKSIRFFPWIYPGTNQKDKDVVASWDHLWFEAFGLQSDYPPLPSEREELMRRLADTQWLCDWPACYWYGLTAHTALEPLGQTQNTEPALAGPALAGSALAGPTHVGSTSAGTPSADTAVDACVWTDHRDLDSFLDWYEQHYHCAPKDDQQDSSSFLSLYLGQDQWQVLCVPWSEPTGETQWKRLERVANDYQQVGWCLGFFVLAWPRTLPAPGTWLAQEETQHHHSRTTAGANGAQEEKHSGPPVNYAAYAHYLWSWTKHPNKPVHPWDAYSHRRLLRAGSRAAGATAHADLCPPSGTPPEWLRRFIPLPVAPVVSGRTAAVDHGAPPGAAGGVGHAGRPHRHELAAQPIPVPPGVEASADQAAHLGHPGSGAAPATQAEEISDALGTDAGGLRDLA